ncbi:PT domain-containing protein [Massilia sp. Root351]
MTNAPTNAPTNQPTNQPTTQPTTQPTSPGKFRYRTAPRGRRTAAP